MEFKHQKELEVGSIVELVATADTTLAVGTLGTIVGVVNIDEKYVTLMPETTYEMFIIKASSVRLMSEAELNEKGIVNVYPELPEEMKVEPTDTVADYIPLMQ